MPKAKFKDIAKQLDQAEKDLDKERREWKSEQRQIQRRNVQLGAVNKELERKNAAQQLVLDKRIKDNASAELLFEQLQDKNLELQQKNDDLETDIKLDTAELEKIRTVLQEQKDGLDKELEEYSLKRKQEIKDGILETHKELTAAKAELKDCTDQTEIKKRELAELNQVYLDEQEAIKLSSAETEQKLEADREKLIETGTKITEAEKILKELEYKQDNAMITLTKAREEHEKYLEYEQRSRKLLDTKDRELQKREADMAEESQFLKNRRSNLPAM